MLTTTEENISILEREGHLTKRPEQYAVTPKPKGTLFSLNLKRLYLYTSVLAIVLFALGLLFALNSQHILMIECFKALLIIGALNFIRVLSIS